MKCVVILLIAIHAIICGGLVHHGPVYGYGVPVTSQPIVYTAPTYHGVHATGPYVAPYTYTSPAVSHSYSHSQTHPVAYVKPVTYFGPSSSYYAPAYGPAAYTSSAYTSGQYYYTPATSNVEHSRLVVPQTNRIFRYQTNQQYNSPESTVQQQQSAGSRGGGGQKPAQTIHIHIQSAPNSPYTQSSSNGQYQDQYNRQNQFNGANQSNRKGFGANNRNIYADRMPYTNNGEQVKLRRYQVHRPGIQKEFYDVEERTIIRPVGSALIELDTPTKKQDITDSQPYGKNSNSNQQRQFHQKGYRPNGTPDSFNTDDDHNDESQQYFSQPEYDQTAPIYRVPDCGGGYDDDDDQIPVTPVNEYGPPVTGFGNRQTPQYHPTTFSPPTNRFPTNNHPTNRYPTTVYPSTPRPTYYPTTNGFYPTTTVQGSYPTTVQGSYPATVQGSYPTTVQGSYPTTVQGSYPTTVQGSYPTTRVQGSYPRTIPPQYPSTPGNTIYRTTPGHYSPSSTKTAGSSTPGQQSDIYISSTTPIAVTIVDKNENATTKTGFQDRDIIYGSPDQGQFEENTPDQVQQHELPPRGDLSRYQSEQSDQFYHELPRSRYTNDPSRQPQAYNVYSRSRGEPTEAPKFDVERENADIVEIDEKKDRNFTNNRNRPLTEQQQQQQGRLIDLYTGGNGGVSEIAQTDEQNTNSRYTSDTNKNGQYQDAGNVRARVISVTPAPATFTPTETVNHRRIVVAKPVELVQEVVEPDDNSTINRQRGNYRSNYADTRANQNFDNQNNDFDSNEESAAQYGGESERYQNGNDNNKFDGNAQSNRNADYQNDGNDDEFNQKQNTNEYNGQYRDGNSNTDYDQNSNFNGQYRNLNSDYNNQYRNENFNRNSNQNAEYNNRNPNQFSTGNDVNYARNSNERQQSTKNAKYEDFVSPTTPAAGVYISTTPSSASQRIIYVQPVSQDFASQKAVSPKKQ